MGYDQHIWESVPHTLEAGCMELIAIFCPIGGGVGGFNLHLRARSFTIELGWDGISRIFGSGEIGFGVLSLSLFLVCIISVY